MEYTYPELKNKLSKLIQNKDTFIVFNLGGQLLEATALIEKAIESAGLSCRIYTRNRSVAAGALAWTGAGLVSLAGIAVHNLATINPDYEIGRDIVNNKLYVEFKKAEN